MHQGTTECCSVSTPACLCYCLSMVVSIPFSFYFFLACVVCIFFHSFPLFWFSSSPSKEVFLKLAHHRLNLSIFCRGEKHLNLSLHLFITCHLQFLHYSAPMSLSPPLHLCMCVLNNLYICQTPPASALYVLQQHCYRIFFYTLGEKIGYY